MMGLKESFLNVIGHLGFKTQEHEFTSNHSPAEIDQIIRENFGKDFWPRPFFPGNIKWAKIKSGFRLRVTIFYGNSFQSFFYMRIKANEIGSSIQGKFLWHPFVRLFSFFWLGGVSLIGSFAVLSYVVKILSSQQLAEARNGLQMIFTPVAMLLFFFLMTILGIFLEEKNRNKILHWVSARLAGPVPRVDAKNSVED